MDLLLQHDFYASAPAATAAPTATPLSGLASNTTLMYGLVAIIIVIIIIGAAIMLMLSRKHHKPKIQQPKTLSFFNISEQ